MGTSPREPDRRKGPALPRPGPPSPWALVAYDALCAAAAVYLAYILRNALRPPYLAPLGHPLSVYTTAIPVVVGLWLLTAYTVGL